MRAFTVSSGLVALAAVVACGLGDSAVPTDQNGLAVASAPGSAVASSNAPETKNFVAHLSGDNEVPTRPTLGQGELKMQLSADGKSLDYRIISSNITNVVQSHIHIAPAGVNGPIAVFLYGLVPAGGGRTDGVLAKGTITAANLIGPMAGHPLSDFIAAIEAGNAYANVHTNDGVDGTNTGPGDFPGGEIRGQVRANGPE